MHIDSEIAAFVNEVVLHNCTSGKIGNFNTAGVAIDAVATDEDASVIRVNAGTGVPDDSIMHHLAGADINAGGIAAGIVVMREAVAGTGCEHDSRSAVGNGGVIVSFD